MKFELGEKNATMISRSKRAEGGEGTAAGDRRGICRQDEDRCVRCREASWSDKKGEQTSFEQSMTHELSDRSMAAERSAPGRASWRVHSEDRRTETARSARPRPGLRLDAGAAEPPDPPNQIAYETATERASTERAATGRRPDAAGGSPISTARLMIQVKEAEMLGSRVADLEARLATQGKLLAERDYESRQLRQTNEAAQRLVQELRDELQASSGGKSPAIEKLRAEKAAIEEQLRLARDERAKTQRDLHAIQQQAENSWATERMENALLRERINDIAAEVAKLAMTLEGPNSAIEAMLAAEPATPAKTARPVNGATTSGGGNGNQPEGGGTLAERIRALQSHASRARQQGA